MKLKVKVENLEISVDDGKPDSIIDYDNQLRRTKEMVVTMTGCVNDLIKSYYPHGKPDDKPHVIDITPKEE